MTNRRLISTLLFSLAAFNTVLMADTSRPRLVVGISVDQLRSDYLEYLKNLFGEKGFRLLMEKGAYIRDLDFRQTVGDATTAAAVIATGAWPADNGVPAATVYNSTVNRALPALVAPDAKGTYTAASYSPESLRLSTLSDEIMIDGIGLAAVYSIAADPQVAVINAGHAARNAIWIDENSGRWTTSSYYPEFPASITNLNRFAAPSLKIDTLQWRPSRPLNLYPGVPAQKKIIPFRHQFSRSDRDVYKHFSQSAPANAEVTDAALAVLKNQNLGKRGDAIDVLNIGYTAAPFKLVKDGDYRLELEDTYLRLDDQLTRLFSEIDKTVGLDNTFIYLTSTGYYDDATIDDAKYRIPGGEFSLKRAESLLNSFLSAKYGNADYVKSIHDGQLYFDNAIIERKALNINTLRTESRDFLMKMSGMRNVYTLNDILSGNSAAESLRLSIDARTAGDLILDFYPGWQIIDDISYPSTTHTVRLGTPATPAFILAPDIEATIINTPVDATQIAPTVASSLHIRSPNGAAQKPLFLPKR